jgi:hypothetical protein
LPYARLRLAEGRACQGFCHGHRPWTPSRKWLRAEGCRHGRASEDASQGVLTTYSRSMPWCLWFPQLCAAFHWFTPTSRGRSMPRPWLYVARTAAVFSFFPQVGLQMALRCYEAVVDRPTVPRSGRRSVSSYHFPSWSGLSDGCWDPLVQSTDTCRRYILVYFILFGSLGNFASSSRKLLMRSSGRKALLGSKRHCMVL